MHHKTDTRFHMILAMAIVVGLSISATAQKKRSAKPVLDFPPQLPDGKTFLEVESEKLLELTTDLQVGVSIAKTPPKVEFLFYPGQDYEGKPWSNWGDSTFANGKYYSAIGDHFAISGKVDGKNGTGTAFIFEYDPMKKTLRELVNTSKFLNLPNGHYTPGKVHTRLDMGSDGWLYYATHRGSSRATTVEYHYKGDWILRTHPETLKTEIVAQGPVPFHAIPNGYLDPKRLIYYGGTAAAFGREEEGIRFFAYDVQNKKLLLSDADGPARYMMYSPTQDAIYFVRGKDEGQLMKYNPEKDKTPQEVPGATIGIRAATEETKNGKIYSVSLGQKSSDANIFEFDVKNELSKKIGTVSVGSEAYVATVNASPSGRYLYYIPGAHGGSYKDGTPIVQFDTRSGKKKVLAFLEPFFTNEYGMTLKGTYGTALSDDGSQLFVTWNVSRGSRAWDCCGLTVIHIPDSERIE